VSIVIHINIINVTVTGWRRRSQRQWNWLKQCA